MTGGVKCPKLQSPGRFGSRNGGGSSSGGGNRGGGDPNNISSDSTIGKGDSKYAGIMGGGGNPKDSGTVAWVVTDGGGDPKDSGIGSDGGMVDSGNAKCQRPKMLVWALMAAQLMVDGGDAKDSGFGSDGCRWW
jgi:hypothetical protein